MRICSIFLCLLSVTAGQGRSQHDGQPDFDGVFFKSELDKLAYEFQSKLREEISTLKLEMYGEFLEVVQQIDGSRQSLSEDISSKLDQQIATVLTKFGKVMKYSAFQIENINEKISAMMRTLSSSSTDDLDPMILFGNDNSIEDYNERRRRGAVQVLSSDVVDELDKPLEELVEAESLSNFDAMKVPASEEKLLKEILDVSDDFDGHIPTRNSDFVLWRQSSDGGQKQYKMSIHRVQKDDDYSAEASKTNDKPRNCHDLLTMGLTQDGVYKIFPQG